MNNETQLVWRLDVVSDDSPAIDAALEAFGATTYASARVEDTADAPWRFSVYFEGEPNLTNLHLPADAQTELAALPPRDWVSESQGNLPPVRVPPFYLHGSHDAAMRGGWRNIEMQAGPAFGSGHHGTTQGCLHLYADVLKQKRPARVADIGCGSGTLAIAAAKAGCAYVLASDNDPIAVAVTRANMWLNTVAPRITAFTASGTAHAAYRGQKFDVVFANIIARPLMRLASDFDAILADNGRLILSGLMNEQARKVSARYRANGLLVERKKIIGPWTSLCLTR